MKVILIYVILSLAIRADGKDVADENTLRYYKLFPQLIDKGVAKELVTFYCGEPDYVDSNRHKYYYFLSESEIKKLKMQGTIVLVFEFDKSWLYRRAVFCSLEKTQVPPSQ